MDTFERLESEVRGYCRGFPTVFKESHGHTLVDEGGKSYIDFFAGAGVLNYGHNPPGLQERLVEYLTSNGVVHALDMATSAKRTFLETFEEVLLKPRDLNYKVQFPGPTGTNAVEAALKLARKVTGRHNVLSFTNGFHGMTMGALAVTGNAMKRGGAGVPLNYARTLPFDGYMGPDMNTLDLVERYLEDDSSGVDKPAAFILETVQAEGGVNVASVEWLQGLQKLAKAHDILLIVDDIQVGCGRTGPFFSFEHAGLKPDMVTLSKSLSGYGLPFALTLFRPEYDIWGPGEHNGTFRGHNPAFVTATAALETFWRDDTLAKDVERKGARAVERLEALAARWPERGMEVRGRGLIQGLDMKEEGIGNDVSTACFERGLIIETAGADDNVVKLLPPLTIDEAALDEGLDIIEASVEEVLGAKSQTAA
ncbi:MAG: diaminobutyrate--2-oxoglutarate transaminase [Myxococcota bacterium]